MSQTSDPKVVTFSVRIYNLLLRFYPTPFRQRYAAEMKQLFRDQCRDASRRASILGLTALWARVLLDWVKTSALEHFADFKQRAVYFRVFALGLAAAFACSACVAYWSPRTYSSMAVVEAESSFAHDPYFIKTQFQIIKSYSVLTNVIVKLGLNQGRAHQNGAALQTMDEAYIRLYKATTVGQRHFTDLIEVAVRNQDPALAAKIANAITESYRAELRVGEGRTIKRIVTRDPAKADWNSGARNRLAVCVAWGLGLTLLVLLFVGDRGKNNLLFHRPSSI